MTLAPNASLLANDASLHYITTTTTLKDAPNIVKHVQSSNVQFKKKKEELLHAVEGRDSIAVEVDTVIEFLTTGGPYLPGLDDNFLANRTVYLLVVRVAVPLDLVRLSHTH